MGSAAVNKRRMELKRWELVARKRDGRFAETSERILEHIEGRKLHTESEHLCDTDQMPDQTACTRSRISMIPAKMPDTRDRIGRSIAVVTTCSPMQAFRETYRPPADPSRSIVRES